MILITNCSSTDTRWSLAPAEFLSAIESEGDPIVLDIYRQESDRIDMIEGAKIVNLSNSADKKALKDLERSEEVYLYCSNGKGSALMKQRLEDLGFTKVYQLRGGLKAWEDAGYSVVPMPDSGR